MVTACRALFSALQQHPDSLQLLVRCFKQLFKHETTAVVPYQPWVTDLHNIFNTLGTCVYSRLLIVAACMCAWDLPWLYSSQTNSTLLSSRNLKRKSGPTGRVSCISLALHYPLPYRTAHGECDSDRQSYPTPTQPTQPRTNSHA